MSSDHHYFDVQVRGEEIGFSVSLDRPAAVNGFLFEFDRKPITIGPNKFDQIWLDRRSVFPTRGRCADNYRALLNFALARAEGLAGGLIDPSVEHIGLAALMPHIRDAGANRVVTDASLRMSEVNRCVNDLQITLASSSQQTIDPVNFMDAVASTIGPDPALIYRLSDTAQAMSDELMGLIRNDIFQRRDLTLPAASTRWNQWMRRFNRAGRHATQIDALNAISLESRAALLQVYSGFWADLLARWDTAVPSSFSRFHQLWHCEWRWQDGEETRHLFQGHCIGLHPAGVLMLKTAAGRSLIAPLLEDSRNEIDFNRFLHGVSCALGIYSGALYDLKQKRQQTRDQRRIDTWRRPSHRRGRDGRPMLAGFAE